MSNIQLPPARAASGRAIQGAWVLGVTNEASGLAVTLYTDSDLDTEVTYPVISDIEGAFAAYAAVGGIHLVEFRPADDVVNNPARWEAIDAEAVASEEARLDVLEGEEARTIFVERHYNAADPEAKRDLLPMLRALDAAYDGGEPLAPGFPGGFGHVKLQTGKQYTIPSGSLDPVDWAFPFADERLIVDIARAGWTGGKGTRIRTDDTGEGAVLQFGCTGSGEWGFNSFAGVGAEVGGFTVEGPVNNDPDAAGAMRGIYLNSEDAHGDVARVKFFDILVCGFLAGWEGRANVHQIEFDNCNEWFNKVGFFIPQGYTNMGERYGFRGGTCAQNTIGLLNEAATSIFINERSWDYGLGAASPLSAQQIADLGLDGWDNLPAACQIVTRNGLVALDLVHLEDQTSADRWFQVFQDIGDTRAVPILSVDVFRMHMGTQTKAPFYCDETCVEGGIELGTALIHSPLGDTVNYKLEHLVEGDGRVSVDGGIRYEKRGTSVTGARVLTYPMISSQRNLLKSYGRRTNLVPNPSFETNLTGWTMYNDAGWATPAAATRVNTWAYSGTWSARIQATKDATATARSFAYYAGSGVAAVPVDPDTDYTLSIRANVIDAPSTGIRARITFYDVAGVLISFHDATLVTGVGEKLLVLTETSPANAAFASPQLYGASSVSGDTVDLGVDAFLFERASIPRTYLDTTRDVGLDAFDTSGSTPGSEPVLDPTEFYDVPDGKAWHFTAAIDGDQSTLKVPVMVEAGDGIHVGFRLKMTGFPLDVSTGIPYGFLVYAQPVAAGDDEEIIGLGRFINFTTEQPTVIAPPDADGWALIQGYVPCRLAGLVELVFTSCHADLPGGWDDSLDVWIDKPEVDVS